MVIKKDEVKGIITELLAMVFFVALTFIAALIIMR